MYPKTLIPKGFEGAEVDCVVLMSRVYGLFEFQKRDATPGHPWLSMGSTKGEIMDKYAPLVIEMVLRTIRSWSRPDLPEDPLQLLAIGATDPLRLMIKNEPHSEKKMREGRFRLIATVPLHISLAEMLLFRDQNEREISHWDQCPSKPGIGLSNPSSVQRFFDTVKEELASGRVASNDMSGYDWSLSQSFFEAEAEMRIKLANAEGTAFARCTRGCFHSLARVVVATSDGQLFSQAIPGVMWSGRYVTSSSDSRIRVLASAAIGSGWCMAMGDDALEEYQEDAPEKYAALGLRCTDNLRCVDSFEFCSHLFKDGKAWTVNPAKMLFNLLNQPKPSQELWNQFLLEVDGSPDLDAILDIVERSGWGAQNSV